MSYYNQVDHDLLERQAIRDVLLELAEGRVVAAPVPAGRTTHLAYLMEQAGSELERSWLRYLDARGHHLPSHAQRLIEACGTRPDFFYDEDQVAIYVDGPPHEYPERQARDAAQEDALLDAGYCVVRFVHDTDWDAVLARYPSIFGPARQSPRPHPAADGQPNADSASDGDGLEIELFEPRWHSLVRALHAAGLAVEPGGDVAGPDGAVIARYGAEVAADGRRIRLVDAADGGAVATARSHEPEILAYLALDPNRGEAAVETSHALGDRS